MHSYIFIIVLCFVTASPLFGGTSSSSLSSPPPSLDSDDSINDSPFPQSPPKAPPQSPPSRVRFTRTTVPKLQKEEFSNFEKKRMAEWVSSVAASKFSLDDLKCNDMNLKKALANYVQDSLQFTEDKTLKKEIDLLENLPEEERTESLLLINTKRNALSKLKIPPSKLFEFLCLVSRKERTLDFVEGVMALFVPPLKQEVLNELHIFSQSSEKASTLSKSQNFFQPGRTMAKNMMNLITVCNRLPSDDEFFSKLGKFKQARRSLILESMASSKEKLSPSIPLELLIVLQKFRPKDRTDETIQNILSVLNYKVEAQKKPFTAAILSTRLNKYNIEKRPRELNRLVFQIQRL